jgi:hypothetical protein
LQHPKEGGHLNVLIIADDPEKTLFHQISTLEDAIEETGVHVRAL